MKPKVTFNRIFNEDIHETIISNDNFIFSIYDQYSDELIPDFERRFSISFDFFNVTDGKYEIQRRIDFEKCSQETLNKWDGYYAAVSKDSYLCFPKNKTWTLKGTILQGNYTYIRIQLEYCQNNKDVNLGPVGSNCIPKNETVKFLEGKRIQMHYIIFNTLINTFNYHNPSEQVAYTGYTNTDSLSWSRLTILFKDLLVETDQGFLTESRQSHIFSAIEGISNEAIHSPETNAVFSNLIGNSRYREIYTRTYIKVQDVFAMMGGFISAAIIILREFTRFLVKPNIVDLFNSLLKYDHLETKINPDYKDFQFFNPKVNNVYVSKIKQEKVNQRSFNESVFSNLDKKKNKQENRKIAESLKLKKKPVDYISNYISNLKEKNFKFNLSIMERISLCKKNFKKNTDKIDSYNLLHNKMLKTISFENFVKLTKKTKYISKILLDDSHTFFIDISMYPRKKVKKKETEHLASIMQLAEKEDLKTMKLIELLQMSDQK